MAMVGKESLRATPKVIGEGSSGSNDQGETRNSVDCSWIFRDTMPRKIRRVLLTLRYLDRNLNSEIALGTDKLRAPSADFCLQMGSHLFISPPRLAITWPISIAVWKFEDVTSPHEVFLLNRRGKGPTTLSLELSARLKAPMYSRLISSIKLTIRAVAQIKNWTSFLLAIKRRETCLFTVRGRILPLRIDIRMPQDVGAIMEAWLDHEYVPTVDYLEGCDRILDIGAHIGTFTCWGAAHNTHATFVSVEPVEENYKMLRTNVSTNIDSGRATLLNAAIGANSGTRVIVTPEASMAGSSSLYHRDGLKYRIDCIGINELISRFGPFDFAKIDAEGSEGEIILSLDSKSLRMLHRISFEYHTDLVPGAKEEIVAFLARNNYRMRTLRHRGTTGIVLAERTK